MGFTAHLVFAPASCSLLVHSAAGVATLLSVHGDLSCSCGFQSVFCLFVQHLLRPSDLCSPPHSVSLSLAGFCSPLIVCVEKGGNLFILLKNKVIWHFSVEVTFILLNCRWYILVSVQLQM